MTQIKPWLAYFIRQAGLLGIIGLVLLASIPAYYLIIAGPLESTASELHAEYASTTQRTTATGEVHRTYAARQQKIDDFYNFFPSSKTALGWIGKLYEVAEREGLQLVHGEYRAAGDQHKHPVQWQVILPVRGSYTQIRRFVTGALAEIPFISLDGIDFQRSAAGNSGIEAKIRFTLYLRGDA